jgi:hypothetical protein
MAAILHLLKAEASPIALETIRQQTASGERVTVVLLEGAKPPAPEGRADAPGFAVRRVPGDLGYTQLLDLIFEADQVIAW